MIPIRVYRMDMIICVCKAVSDKHIRAAVQRGARSLHQIVGELGVGTCCGSCVSHVEETLAESVDSRDCLSAAVE